MPAWRLTQQNLDATLSAYVDGELDAATTAALGERLVLEPSLHQRLHAVEAVDRVTRASLAPAAAPDPNAAAQAVLRRLALVGARNPVRVAASPARRPLYRRPVFLASLGLVLTAGLTLAELRRRRLV